jgi:hypothetical protein
VIKTRQIGVGFEAQVLKFPELKIRQFKAIFDAKYWEIL